MSTLHRMGGCDVASVRRREQRSTHGRAHGPQRSVRMEMAADWRRRNTTVTCCERCGSILKEPTASSCRPASDGDPGDRHRPPRSACSVCHHPDPWLRRGRRSSAANLRGHHAAPRSRARRRKSGMGRSPLMTAAVRDKGARSVRIRSRRGTSASEAAVGLRNKDAQSERRHDADGAAAVQKRTRPCATSASVMVVGDHHGCIRCAANAPASAPAVDCGALAAHKRRTSATACISERWGEASDLICGIGR